MHLGLLGAWNSNEPTVTDHKRPWTGCLSQHPKSRACCAGPVHWTLFPAALPFGTPLRHLWLLVAPPHLLSARSHPPPLRLVRTTWFRPLLLSLGLKCKLHPRHDSMPLGCTSLPRPTCRYSHIIHDYISISSSPDTLLPLPFSRLHLSLRIVCSVEPSTD